MREEEKGEGGERRKEREKRREEGEGFMLCDEREEKGR